MRKLTARWVDGGREPECAPDPRYPKGIDVNMAGNRFACEMRLPHPAQRCGYYVVSCAACGLEVVVTTAGRPDDPRSVRVACKTVR